MQARKHRFSRATRVGVAVGLCLLWGQVAQSADATSVIVHVVDLQGAPLAGATTQLYTREGGVSQRGVTGDDGRCRFALAGGEYVIKVAAAGFAGSEARRVRVAAGSHSETFELTLATREESIVVTAAAAPQTLAEVSKALTSVGLLEIDERDELSISESVRRVPGTRVQQRGGPGGLTSVRLRGLRSEDTAVLVDGVRFRDPTSTQGDASALLGDMIVTGIDRIEVLRGSGSSLYGTNAIGGALNIITDAGGGAPRGGLLAEGGSLGLFRGRGNLAGSAGERWLYSLGLAQMNALDGVDGKGAARNTSGQGRIQFQLSPATSLTARLYSSGSRADLTESPQAVGTLPSGILTAQPLSREQLARYESGTPIGDLDLGDATFIENALDADNRREASFHSALLRIEQRPSARWGYNVSYHGLWTSRDFIEGPLGLSPFEPTTATRSQFDGTVHTLSGRADISVAKSHVLSAGYEWESERLRNAEGVGDVSVVSSTDVTQDSHTAYAQLQLRALDGALQISGSARAQYFRLDVPQFTPQDSSPYRNTSVSPAEDAYTADGSVVYSIQASGTRVRAHLGSGYRAPSLFERFGALYGSFGYSVFGDPRLSPEHSLGVDVGFDQTIAGGRARATLTSFWTRLDDVIVFDFSGAIDPGSDPFGRFGGYLNAGGGTAKGLEASLSAQTNDGLHIDASYTFADAEPPTGVSDDADRAFVIPRHQLSVVATQTLGPFYLNLDWAYSSTYLTPIFDPTTFASRTYEFEGIHKVDVGAGYRLRLRNGHTVRLFGKLDNALDQQYFENGFRSPGLTAVAGAAFEF